MTPVRWPARSPTYSSGAPAGPGITERAQAGSASFVALPTWTLDRSTYLRIGSSGSVAMPGSMSDPMTSPSALVAGGAIARIAARGSSAGR